LLLVALAFGVALVAQPMLGGGPRSAKPSAAAQEASQARAKARLRLAAVSAVPALKDPRDPVPARKPERIVPDGGAAVPQIAPTPVTGDASPTPTPTASPRRTPRRLACRRPRRRKARRLRRRRRRPRASSTPPASHERVDSLHLRPPHDRRPGSHRRGLHPDPRRGVRRTCIRRSPEAAQMVG